MTRRSKASEQRSREVARAFEKLLLETRGDSYEVLESRYKALARELERTVVKTVFERQELRRRVAERLFTEAYEHDSPWAVFGRTLRRVQKEGYSNVERRYHVACLYAMWCERHPEHGRREARQMLEATERHLLRLPRTSQLRQGLLEALAKTRRETGL